MKPVNPADRRVVNIKSGEFKPFVYEDGAAFGDSTSNGASWAEAVDARNAISARTASAVPWRGVGKRAWRMESPFDPQRSRAIAARQLAVRGER